MTEDNKTTDSPEVDFKKPKNSSILPYLKTGLRPVFWYGGKSKN